jgi:hypothetical protein
MRCVVNAVFAFVALAVVASIVPQSASAADTPTDRTVVMYFHRTQRCPTCLKMGSYSEESVKSGFAQQIKNGKVEFHYIDFQDAKNSALTKGYKVGGPTLIVAKVSGNKVAEFKNLTEIWTKVRDKAAFIDYVQTSVENYQK